MGLWSLSSGRFINHAKISSSSASSSFAKNFCELSRNVTSAWDYTTVPDGDNDDARNHLALREKKGHWGLWMKCGSVLNWNSSPPPTAGGIHHIVFPGSMKTTGGAW